MARNILMLEGEGDKQFFGALLNDLNIKAKIIIGNGKRSGKNNLIDNIEEVIKEFINDDLRKLVMIMDADGIAENSLGYAPTIKKVIEKLGNQVEQLPTNTGDPLQFCLPVIDQIPRIHVWIMPHNKDNGSFEDYIQTYCKDRALLELAKDTVKRLVKPKFPNHKTNKAEVMTWLAWQQEPDKNLASLVGDELMDCQPMINWLKTIFDENTGETP